MYTNLRNAAHAYTNIGLETGVAAASSHQLIMMLYEGAELSVRLAIRHMGERDLAKKSAAISKASIIILEGLRAALDPQQGGDLALRLDALYEYMSKRLMVAHLNNESAPLEEVLVLLRELHEAWRQIGPVAQASAQTLPHSIAA